MNKLPAQPNKSLIDGITVLQELSRRGIPTSCLELARDLGMENTRVHRILKTLAFLGLTKTNKSRKYMCGDGMHILAAQSLFGSGLLQIAIRYLEKLHACGLTVALGVLWRDKTSYLYHHDPRKKSTIEGLGGSGSVPLGMSSIGMVLMAQKSDSEIVEILTEHPAEGYCGTMDDFMLEMKKTRERGYADVVTDHRSMAITIGHPAFASIAFAGNIPDSDVDKYLQILKSTAKQIEEDLDAHQNS